MTITNPFRLFRLSQYLYGLFILANFLFYLPLNAQNTTDKNSNEPYDTLKVDFRKFPIDTIKSLLKTQAFLYQAKKTQDTLRMLEGFLTMANITPIETAHVYSDSLIRLASIHNKENEFLPRGLIQKGRMYYRTGQYSSAFDYYLKGLEQNNGKNKSLEAIANFNIGLIKSFIGRRDEAVNYFDKYSFFLHNSSSKSENTDFYLTRLYYAKSDAYLFLNKIDSSLYYTNLGLEKSLEVKDTIYLNRFKLNRAISQFFLTNYNEAIKILNGIKLNIEKDSDPTIRALAYLYMAKTHQKLNQTKSYFSRLKQAENIINTSKEISPELIETFFLLKDYYNKASRKEDLLNTINSIIYYDSILYTYSTDIDLKIKRQYEIPSLIAEKNSIILTLRERESNMKRWYTFLVFPLIIALVFITFQLNRNRVLKSKFQHLLKELDGNSDVVMAKKQEGIGISDEIFENIISGLEKFEKNEIFLRKNYSLNKLAKELKTNSAYLSKTINYHKGINFSTYMNQLRVNSAIKKLRTDTNFRKYTIEAIANEVGFNNAQSFTAAFLKQTGLYPSYFIKKLNKERDQNL